MPKWNNSFEKPYEGASDIISYRHGKYKLGIIANQEPGTQGRIDNWGIGKYFDVVMPSADAIMVGDRLDNDIVPAKKLGMFKC